MRSAFGKFLVASAALLCACAMVATAAQAVVIGPKWRVAGNELKTGETVEVSSASSPGEISFTGYKEIVVTCKKPTVTGASITGGLPGTIKAALSLAECTVTGNGEKCKVPNVTTKTLEGALAYQTKERTGKLLALLKSSTEEVFEFKFEGEKCKFANTEVKGSFVGEFVAGGKEAEEVGSEAAAKVVGLRFPTSAIKKVWTEKEGALKEEEAKLTAFGNETTTIAGTVELELSGLKEWEATAWPSELPFWSVAGAHLNSGESHEVISASSPGELSIEWPRGSATVVKCKKANVDDASIIGGSPGTLKATLSLKECTITGDGKECRAPSSIVTSVVEGPLVYETKEGTGKILVLLKAPGTLSTLYSFELEGSCRTVTRWEGDGSFVGEVVVGGKPEEVRSETTAEVVGLRFPTIPISTVWVDERNGKGEEVIKEETAKISDLGERAAIAGTAEVELGGLEVWGAHGL
jgi:hypothetical protein